MTFELPPVKSDAEMLADVLTFTKKNNFIIEEKSDKIILTHPSQNYKMLLRKNTSDFHVFAEIFMKNEYEFLMTNYEKYAKNITPNVIIDIGANIGCATLYFKQCYPKANIVSVEAEKNNFSALKQNIKMNNYENIYLYHNAFWINEENLMVEESFRDGRDWAFAIRPTAQKSTQTIKGLTLQNIIEKHNFETIDILKIDIEGGEKWILEDEISMKIIQKNVKILLIEIHEEVISMHNASKIISDFGFHFIIQNTLLFAYQSL